VIHFSIDQKVKRRPHYGKIVVDPDQRIVNAFFHVRCAGLAYALCKGVECHLGGLAIAHQHHHSAGH
jgi:hypothetical protein